MSISSTGIGSGLDVSSIVSQLVALEKKPLANLQSTAVRIQTQISTYGQVQSLISDLSAAATELTKAGLWTQNTATSSNTSTLTASAKAGAASGTYSVQVKQLASAQSLASGSFASSTSVLGSGKLTIELGTWSGGATADDPATNAIDESAPSDFVPKGEAKKLDLTFNSATTTLADVRDAINNAKSGVTASIVKDSSGARLLVRSNSTGEENAMRISATQIDSETPLTDGFAKLNYINPQAVGGTGMTQTVAATNARATIDGLAISSSNNTFSDVIEGVSFTVAATTTSPVTLSIGNDTGSQRAAVQRFAASYNALNGFLTRQTAYDAATKVGGTLQGDNTVLNLRGRLRGLLSDNGAADFSILSLTSSSAATPRDGSLTLDTAKLDAALSDPSKLAKLFAGNSESGVTGMAQKLADFATALTGSDGLLSTRKEGLTKSLTRNQKDQEKLEDRVAKVAERLNKQYQALDGRMASLNTLSTYINQQVTQWNNNSNK
ncbi:flagellar filament capping protein FliD [Aquabacterium sp. G14]|uniref:flagellar filament capping protein FliD n=1 Tax=Aquabacterium sp. G14 TaxID=3130164 RepID=UPI0030A8A5CA